MKDKIIIVGPGPEFIGGISEFIQGIFNSNLNEKFELILFDSLKIKQRKRIHDKTPLKLTEIVSSVKLFCCFFCLLLKISKAKIHIHSSSYFGFYEKLILLIIAKQFQRKVLFHIHGGEFVSFFSNNKYKVMLKTILALSEKIICVSNEIKEVIGLPEKSLVMGNGISIPKNISFKKQENPIVFLSVSVLEFRKRIDLILHAVLDISKQGIVNFKFIFAGDGPEKEKLLQILKETGIEEYVQYAGVVRFKEKDKLFRDSHVFISTSLSESFGISIAEGMSYGLGIISTEEGIATSCIQSCNGILIKKNDLESLKNAMIRYINGSEKINLQSRNNAKFIQNTYSWQTISNTLELYYRS